MTSERKLQMLYYSPCYTFKHTNTLNYSRLSLDRPQTNKICTIFPATKQFLVSDLELETLTYDLETVILIIYLRRQTTQ